MVLRLSCFIIVSLFCKLLQAQEGLRPLISNINYVYPELRKNFTTSKSHTLQQKGTAASLFLPFKDDFSYAPTSTYARPDLWNDSSTYINWGFPIAPPSIGVATFDGLNQFGFPYTPNLVNPIQPYSADELNSRAINLQVTASSQTLQPSDSVALSFYYQARGNGESPDVGDSLILDLFKPFQNKWQTRAWFAKGNANPNINDSSFKRAFVWLSDTAYLHDGFKFRLRNKANASGDFDHWHLDYVLIDKNRSFIADTIYNDLTFAGLPTPFIQPYSSMPYEQYMASNMASRNSVRIKNNGALAVNHIYENRIYNDTQTQLHLYQGGPTNLCPFINTSCSSHGYSTYQPHANPLVNYTFATMVDSADFTIKHYLSLTGAATDFIKENDTLIQLQRFKNYYAYDDGSAEGGYFVNGIGGKLALKITLNNPDILRSVRIYFDPVGNIALSESSYKFTIKVWSDSTNGPTKSVLYSEVANYPKYFKNVFKGMAEYKLSQALSLPAGTYYIGIQQQVATGITIGFDKNYDSHTALYYDDGSGWAQSSLKGSLMLHPVLGKPANIPVEIPENKSAENELVLVYPNPANTILNIESASENPLTEILVRNSLGQVVFKDTQPLSKISLDTQFFSPGLYFLSLRTADQNICKKILIQH